MCSHSHIVLIAFARNSFKLWQTEGKTEDEINFFSHEKLFSVHILEQMRVRDAWQKFSFHSLVVVVVVCYCHSFVGFSFFSVKFENEHLFMVKISMGFVVKVLNSGIHSLLSPEKFSLFYLKCSSYLIVNAVKFYSRWPVVKRELFRFYVATIIMC